MKIELRFVFAVLLAFLIPDVVWANPVAYGPALQPGTVFDGIASTFQNSTASWMNSAQGYAKDLFLSLSVIEFTWAAIQLTLKKGELQDMIASTMLKIVGIGFFYSLLMEAPTWIPAIMNSFGAVGAAVGSGGGSSAMLSPSGVFDEGIQVASALVDQLNKTNSSTNGGLVNAVTSGGASIGNFLFGAIVTGLTGLLTILAFTLVAVQLMVTLIESYVIISGGVLMLGFTGSRWTLPFGEKYFGYAVSTGIKLFTLYLIVGQGQNVANAIIHGLNTVNNGHGPGAVDFLGAGASSLAYGAMGYMVPAMAGSMMNGAPALSLGTMAGAGGGMAGSLIGGAAMVGSTLMSGAGAATSFDKTMKAAGNIGGDKMPGGGGGSIGGALSAGTGNASSAPATAAFGAGTGSPVAAPPGMATPGETGGSGSSAKPAVAPASMTSPTESINAGSGSGSPAGPATGSSAPSGPAAEVSMPLAQNVSSNADISSKGGTDAISSTAKKGIDFAKGAENLNDMARRMDRLPTNDGHSGGISIRFNHIE